MALNDAPAQRESQSRPFAERLGREKRLEDPARDLRGDPRAVVPHLDDGTPEWGVETQP